MGTVAAIPDVTKTGELWISQTELNAKLLGQFPTFPPCETRDAATCGEAGDGFGVSGVEDDEGGVSGVTGPPSTATPTATPVCCRLLAVNCSVDDTSWLSRCKCAWAKSCC